jgi:lipopolysaccharide export LptBFGC system permease protein LptF
MKILDRYLLRSFWSTFGYIVLSCYCLLLILELFQNFGDILENQTPFLRAVQYLWCAMPYKVMEVLPLALMLAVLFSVGQLAHNSEILAMTAAGVSIFRVAAPLLLSALLISALMIVANETIIYSWQKKALGLERQYVEGKEEEVRHRNIRERGEGNRLYLIVEYEIVPKVMRGVQIFDRDPENNRVRSQLLAESARWLRHDVQTDRDIWELTNGVRRQLDRAGKVIGFEELGAAPTTDSIASKPRAVDDATTSVVKGATGVVDRATTSVANHATTGTIDRSTTLVVDHATTGIIDRVTTGIIDRATTSVVDSVTTAAIADPVTTAVLENAPATTDSVIIRTAEVALESALTQALAVRKTPEEMNAFELNAYIRQREAMQKTTADYRGKLYLRLLFPFSCVVMLLIGFPFALRAQRGRAMVAGFSLGILCAIAFYATTAFLSALVEQEIIPPWAPAVIPLVAFSIFGFFLIRRSAFCQ